jgi:low temperature requirement protein LtrA
VFAAAYAFMQVGRSVFMLWALRNHDASNYRNFLRITAWLALAAVLWIAGALVEGRERLVLWALAVGIEYLSPAVGMWVPGLGQSTPEEWQIDGGHLAERCAGFIIIALGESVLVTGATFANMPWQSLTTLDFSANFIGAVAMWAIYFNVGAERASRLIAEANDPGRLGRSGYTYLHILIVAGIIVTAVADELALAHPNGEADLKTVLVMVGGPALYLLGTALFKRLTASNVPLSHLVGLGLLALLASTAAFATPFLLTIGTSAILVMVVVWEWASFRRRRPRSPEHGH